MIRLPPRSTRTYPLFPSTTLFRSTGVVYDITPDTGVSDPQFNPGETGCERTDDFHCFATADRFNFAPYNLLLTPSERKSVFGQVRFDFTPTFSGHAKVLYN